MSSKAARRRDAGVVRAGPGGGAAGGKGTRLPQALPGITPGLVKRLSRCQPWERDGIRQVLREDGSPKARDALEKLERRWAVMTENEQETCNVSRQRTAQLHHDGRSR